MSWLRLLEGLRTAARGAAGTAAMRDETAAVAAATRMDAVGPGLRAHTAPTGTMRPGTVTVGTFIDEPGLDLLLPVKSAAVHGLILGATGSGKSRLLLGILRAKLAHLARSPARADRVAVLDPKSELVALVKDATAALVPLLPEREAEALIDRLVIVNPFATDTSALPPLNVLAVPDAADEEASAWDLAGLIARLAGAPLGVHQESFTYFAVLLGTELASRGETFTLFDLARLIDAPNELSALGRRSSYPSVRDYFAATRIPAQSLHGVRARLHRLLRLPSRRMFGARTCLPFDLMLRERVLLADVGDVPLGSSDVAAFCMGFFASRLMRAVRARRANEPDCVLAIDEWQRVVGASPWLAAEFGDVLSVCRSKGVRLVLVSQSLAAVGDVSSTLARVALTNADQGFYFRASAEDARNIAHLLPQTGRRPRVPPAPWEDQRSRSPFLTPAEERAALTETMSRLPQRAFLFVDRTSTEPGVFVRAAEVHVERPAVMRAGLTRRIDRGAITLGPEETVAPQAALARTDAPVFRRRSPNAEPPPPRPRLPRRRDRLG